MFWSTFNITTFASIAQLGWVSGYCNKFWHVNEITSADLNGDIEEDKFMKVPKYFTEALEIIIRTDNRDSEPRIKAKLMLNDQEKEVKHISYRNHSMVFFQPEVNGTKGSARCL